MENELTAQELRLAAGAIDMAAEMAYEAGHVVEYATELWAIMEKLLRIAEQMDGKPRAWGASESAAE